MTQAVRNLHQTWPTHQSVVIRSRASTIRFHGRMSAHHLRPPPTGDLPDCLTASTSRDRTSPRSTPPWTALARHRKHDTAVNFPRMRIRPVNHSSVACPIPSVMAAVSVTKASDLARTANILARLLMAVRLAQISEAPRPAPHKPKRLPGFAMSFARNVSVWQKWRLLSASLQM